MQHALDYIKRRKLANHQNVQISASWSDWTIWSMWSPSNLLLPLDFPHHVVFIPLNSQTKQTLSSVSSCQVFCHKHKKSNQHKKFYVTISYQGLDNKFSNTDLSIVSYIWKKINLKWNYLVNWCCMWNLWYSGNSKIGGDKIGSQKIYTKNRYMASITTHNFPYYQHSKLE